MLNLQRSNACITIKSTTGKIKKILTLEKKMYLRKINFWDLMQNICMFQSSYQNLKQDGWRIQSRLEQNALIYKNRNANLFRVKNEIQTRVIFLEICYSSGILKTSKSKKFIQDIIRHKILIIKIIS